MGSKGKNSIEDRLIGRLEEFNESLRNGEDVCTKYTTRKVSIKLMPTKYDPDLVRATRDTLGMSQALFAQFIGKSTKAVQAWEQGINEPNPMACRFMDAIRHDPNYWKTRFLDMVEA